MNRTPDTNEERSATAALWDATDVARYLKVSRSWVYHRAETGELPCLKGRRFAPLRSASNPRVARGVPAHGARVVQFPAQVMTADADERAKLLAIGFWSNSVRPDYPTAQSLVGPLEVESERSKVVALPSQRFGDRSVAEGESSLPLRVRHA